MRVNNETVVIRHKHTQGGNNMCACYMMTRQSFPWLPWKLCLAHQCSLKKRFDLLLESSVFVCVRISSEQVM